MRGVLIAAACAACGLGGFVGGQFLDGSRAPAPPPPSRAPAGGVFALYDEARQAELRACGVDETALADLLALDMNAFDQDFSGGWRAIEYRDGCSVAAATVIEAYTLYSTPHAPQGSLVMLRWHAGQALANAGAYDQARAFFAGSYQPGSDQGSAEWNLYVDGTLAFLDRDQGALMAARTVLAAMPVSAEERAARQAFLDDNPRISMPDGFVDEPSNLNVLDDFLACWDRSYADAYGPACRH